MSPILLQVVPVLPDSEIQNLERLRKQKVSGQQLQASAHVLHLPSIIVQLFEAQKKSEKYKVKCFQKAEWFRKVPQKIQRITNGSKKLRASRRGRKCWGSISGCQKFRRSQKMYGSLRLVQGGSESAGRV